MFQGDYPDVTARAPSGKTVDGSGHAESLLQGTILSDTRTELVYHGRFRTKLFANSRASTVHEQYTKGF